MANRLGQSFFYWSFPRSTPKECGKNEKPVKEFIYLPHLLLIHRVCVTTALLRGLLRSRRRRCRGWNGKFQTINNSSKSRRQSRNFVLKLSLQDIVTLTCANKSADTVGRSSDSPPPAAQPVADTLPSAPLIGDEPPVAGEWNTKIGDTAKWNFRSDDLRKRFSLSHIWDQDDLERRHHSQETRLCRCSNPDPLNSGL